MRDGADMKKQNIFIGALVMAAGGLFGTMLLSNASTTTILLPDADGTYTDWKPSAGTSRVAMVDDPLSGPCNGVVDYVAHTANNKRTSFRVSLASVPDGSTITDIRVIPCASNNISGSTASTTLNVFYRLNGMNSADSGTYSLKGTTPFALATTTFSGLSIKKSSRGILEVGAVTTAGTLGARLSRMLVQVIYTP